MDIINAREEKKRIKAEKKAAAAAKQLAISDGSFIETIVPKKKKVETDDYGNIVDDGEVHLLTVYSAQVGAMAEWIKKGKHTGTETIFYSSTSLMPLLKTLRELKTHQHPEQLLSELIEHANNL